MAVKDKKARFNPFVPPTHFQQQVGWGTRLGIDKMKYDNALLRVVCELGTKAKDLSGKNMLMT